MTRLEPAVYLAIDGVDVARSTVAGVPTELLALDGLSIIWGRQEALDQQEPATGGLELFDPSKRWHRSRDWIGARVDLRWQVTVAGVTTVRTFFRGRISRINPRMTELAGVRGCLTALEVTSKVTDLANVIPTTAWPDENFGVETTTPVFIGARRKRVSNAVVAAGLAGGVTTRTDWDNMASEPIAVQDQVSLAEHVTAIYDSLVERMNYSPQTDGFTQVDSRDYSSRKTLGVLVSDPAGAAADRAGQGVYIRARALNGGAGIYLDGREIDYDSDAGIARDQGSAITRIRIAGLRYINSTFVPYTLEIMVTGANEAVTGVRTIDVNTQFSIDPTSTLIPARWQTLVRSEVASWQMAPLTMRTAVTGGLENLAQVTALMSGEESNALVFLQGSDFPTMGVSPVVGIMGGTLTLQDGHWELEWTPAPISYLATQHPISWEELDDGTPANQVQAWDTPHPLGLHDSLTFEDLAWVGLGHGVPDTGTFIDRGWDYPA